MRAGVAHWRAARSSGGLSARFHTGSDGRRALRGQPGVLVGQPQHGLRLPHAASAAGAWLAAEVLAAVEDVHEGVAEEIPSEEEEDDFTVAMRPRNVVLFVCTR